MKKMYQISLKKYSKKTVDEIRAKVHKNTINTITMVNTSTNFISSLKN